VSKSFGRVIEVTSGPVKLNNTDLDIEFDIPFDDDLTPNLSTVSIYNLTKNTINQLKRGQKLSVIAGYKEDKGLILEGTIEMQYSKWIGADKLTIIKILDSIPYDADKTVKRTYKQGIKADAIIRDLAKQIGLKIAALRLPENKVFKNGHTANGEGLQEIQNIARDCGASCYISRGQSYIRPLTDGDDHQFKLSAETGLIGSPEFFEQERYGKVEKGYSLVSLLQYRMNTASIVHVESKEVKAKLRVQKGRHVCRSNEFYTKVEALL